RGEGRGFRGPLGVRRQVVFALGAGDRGQPLPQAAGIGQAVDVRAGDDEGVAQNGLGFVGVAEPAQAEAVELVPVGVVEAFIGQGRARTAGSQGEGKVPVHHVTRIYGHRVRNGSLSPKYTANVRLALTSHASGVARFRIDGPAPSSARISGTHPLLL